MATILTVSGLTKSFGPIRAVNSISFTIGTGQVVGLLGPNGSGKTTTLALLLGIKLPDSGLYQWFDGDTSKPPNQRIGSLLEVPYFYPYLSLEKNLKIVASIRKQGMNDIHQVLHEVGLGKRIQSAYYTLSLGMKQRLALASVLLGNPDVLILDEPTNGLDPVGIAEVRGIIMHQAQMGKTIILASHILDEVERVCSDVIVLKEGRVLGQGPVKELLAHKQLVSLSANEPNELVSALMLHPDVKVIETRANQVLISIEGATTTAQLNQWLLAKGVVLSGITEHRKTLESMFLEMIRREESNVRSH